MITVCITTHNRREQMEALLMSEHFRAAVQSQQARVLVLAQGCTDGTNERLAVFASPVFSWWFTVWGSSQFLSTAASRQRMVDRLIGAGLKRSDTVIFLDDDVMPVDGDWLKRLISGLDQADVCGAEGRFITEDWLTRPGTPDELPGVVDYVGGGWCAASGDVFLSGVEFDQRFIGTYWEDVDLCLQIRAKNGIVWGLGDVGLEHRHDGELTLQQIAWSTANRELVFQKWAGKGLIKAEQGYARE